MTSPPLATDAVSVAAVHATIISIFAAIAVGYFAIVFDRLDALTSEIIDQANAIGHGAVNIAIRHPEEGGYDSRGWPGNGRHANRRWLIHVIDMIALGQPAYALYGDGDVIHLDDRVPTLDQPAERANYLLACLSLLLRTYPLHGETLKSVKEVRAWSALAKGTIGSLLPLETRHAFVEGLVKQAQEDWSGKQTDQPHLGASAKAAVETDSYFENPANQYRVFDNRIREVYGELEAVDAHLARYTAYRDRLPSRTLVRVAFAGAVVAFSTGVLIPLIETHARRSIYVGVPCTVYGLGIVSAGVALWSRYRRPGPTTDSP
jgi:hypothetical protein